MITFQEHTGFIRIEEYSLAAWLAEVEQVINQGYTFNFESNDTHPQVFGSMYTVLMVPTVSEVETEVAPEVPAPESQSTETTPVEPVAEVQVEPAVQTKRKNAKA